MQSKKTLVMFVPWMVLGGADKCGIDILRVAKEAGWITVVVSTRRNAFGNTWEAEFRRYADEIVDLSNRPLVGPRTELPDEVRHLLRSRQPDCVLINNSHEAYKMIGVIRSAVPKACLAALVHMRLKGEWDFPAIISRRHEFFDRVLTVSDDLATQMVDLGMPRDKVSALHWFADGDTFYPSESLGLVARNLYGLSLSDRVVLFPARLNPQKRPEMVPKIVSAFGDKAVKVLVGGYGNSLTSMSNVARSLGVIDQMIFCSGIPPEDMPQAYRASDVVLLPSIDEGIPIAYYEAMACSVPIVASDVGAVHELVTPETGSLIPLRRPLEEAAEIEDYCSALRIALSVKGREMAEVGRKRVLTKFSYRDFKRRVLEAISESRDPGAIAKKLPIIKKGTEKVFIIGMAKTGTSSVGEALAELGYSVYKWDPHLQELYWLGVREKMWEAVEIYDAFSDGPFNTGDCYRELLGRYPSAKFILTYREEFSWLKSHEHHFSASGSSEVPGKWKLETYDPDLWLRFYRQRNGEIVDHFKKQGKSSSLLRINVCDGREGWQELCSFLGEKVPEGMPDFPYKNKARYYVPSQRP